ncbi:ATP-binding protein [Terrabacter sp. RAF57]|uniref:ATP-binding protein n=1 Tax=Terrabacter sp. RAF57 TaxID=3233063 RepID=UPI003F9EBA50
MGGLARALTWAVDHHLEPMRGPGSALQQYARLLLDRATTMAAGGDDHGPGVRPTPAEEDRISHLASEAARAGIEVPWLTLRARGLRPTDLDVLLVACAPMVEPAFGGLYAYLQDSFDAIEPGVRLAVQLLARTPEEERSVTEAAGPFGLLRTAGLLDVSLPDRLVGPLLRPAPGVLELLRGSHVDLALLGLPGVRAGAGPIPSGLDPDDLDRLADAIEARTVDLVGVWGTGPHGGDAVATVLCGGRPFVRVPSQRAAAGLQRARITDSVCVVDLGDEASDADRETLLGLFARSAAPVLVLAPEPLPLARLWSSRRVAELRVDVPSRLQRSRAWAAAFPELSGDAADDLAGRFGLGDEDLRGLAVQDATAGAWANGHRPSIDELATRMSRPRSPSLASIVTPRRGRDLLVLPAADEARVLRVAQDFRAWPRVAESWRLDRFGGSGVTALFAGEPGTGKTLAAEVVAAEIGLDLMVADLSLLVSKWVGETEKNLDVVFTEAGSSHCVLFFDEADTLFGRRGDVDRGSDRYANLEVGFLLQRLDRYDGLVVLATNLRDQLDDAFTRRFHHVVNFPKPGPDERRRLWELVLGAPVVLDGEVDLDLLTSLDLTGAGVAAIVRSAALAAHHDHRRALTMADLVRAVARLFQREARLVPRDLVATYAPELS